MNEIKAKYQELLENNKNFTGLNLDKYKDKFITFLGTGCMKPSVYRNVSAIFVQFLQN